jgi:NAD/NADP transhydrogenase beta subunit
MKVEGVHTTTNVDAVGEMIATSKEVVIVPGYGLAAAQGQYPLAEMVRICGENGINVKFAIHPVAGRMPG